MKESTLTLPRDVTLSDGSAVTLRRLTRLDAVAFLAFARSLPEHDLLFLRTDITNPDVLEVWFDNIDLERIITIIAERDGLILGYGSLHMSAAQWSQHVGELRALIAESMRGKGLGRALTEAVFAQALERGIEKMVAQMTVDQKGAIATFEELGFRAEAMLLDHVKDREGHKHDLLVYSHDVTGFHAQLDAYGVSEAAAGGGE
ncbi:MAG: GNAT family N-acetyltransferase [Chloroflexi bacterium]|nr:GNAT family N-acetyltransferase [Chloroflexota bacterium]